MSHCIVVSQLLGEDRFQDIEKIKTIGSTYMAVSGLSPEKQVSYLFYPNLYKQTYIKNFHTPTYPIPPVWSRILTFSSLSFFFSSPLPFTAM